MADPYAQAGLPPQALAALFAAIQQQPNGPLPPNVTQAYQQKGLTSAGGSALRSAPPKAMQAPGMEKPSGMPQGPGPIPAGAIPPAAASPKPATPPPAAPGPAQPPPVDYAAKLAGLLGQNAPIPPFVPPTEPGYNKYFLLGQALSALINPKLAPFAANAVAYDQQMRDKQYEDRYKAAMDAWNSRAEAAKAANEGRTSDAEILKALATMPGQFVQIDQGVDKPRPTKGGGLYDPSTNRTYTTDFEKQMAMVRYYERLVSNRVSHGAQAKDITDLNSMISGLRQTAMDDYKVEAGEGKHPVQAGTVDPVTGDIVQPGDPRALAYDKQQSDMQFAQLKVQWEQQVVNGTTAPDRMRAEQIANQAQFHADSIGEQNANRQTRVAIAVLGVQAAGVRADASHIWQAGLQAYKDKQAALRAQAALSTDSTQQTTLLNQAANLPPPAPTTVDLNITLDKNGNPVTTPTNNVPPPPHIADPVLARVYAGPVVAALPPQVKASLDLMFSAKDASVKGAIGIFSQIATGKKASPYYTPDQATQILHALAKPGQ